MFSKNLKIFLIALVVLLVLAISFFYLRKQVYFSHGSFSENKIFAIKEGEGNAEIASRLQSDGLISGKIYFYYYIRSHQLLNKIMPGEYQLSGALSIPEIARVITNPEKQFVKITFPEGFSMKQMADRLEKNSLPGEKFLEVANNPTDFKKRYSYLSGDKITTLEGYLFPDTYFFEKDATAENIVGRMLDNFDSKLNEKMRQDIAGQNKNINDIVIMASIAEREVQAAEDMKIVAGIFWNRIATGQKLQSDAPLSYILDDKNDQHSGADLQTDSPFNTYLYLGLPPAPIGNPGLNAITAAIYPTASDYNYFLTATESGKKQVFYSATFEEHVANRQKYGL